MNPILQKLQPQNNLVDIRQMMNMVRGCGNPMGMMQMLAQNNPKIKQAMDVVQKFSSPQQAFYSEAQRLGADPNSILNQLK